MTQPTIEQMIAFLSMRITAGMMTAGYYRGDAMAVEFVDMNMAIRAALTAQGLPEAQTADAKRLDYLDARNAAKNLRHGTKYGWQLSENCNRIALEDHGWPPLNVRDAIDAAIAAARRRRTVRDEACK